MKQLKRKPNPQLMSKSQLQPTKPLPPDPQKQNATHARHAAAALAAFQRQTGVDLENLVSDLLVDLMHWCDRKGPKFHEELRRALNYYATETAAPSTTTAPRSVAL